MAKAGDDPKARRKAVRGQAPERFVHYDEATLERLVAATPEPLVSRFRVTADLVATVLGRPDGPDGAQAPAATNHDTDCASGPAHPTGDRRLPQPRGGRGGRAVRDADGRCAGVRVGSLVEGSDERSRAAVLVAARGVRHRGDRDARPRRSRLRARRRQRGRVGARRPPPDPARPARRGRRGGRAPEGRGRAVRGAHGAARHGHLPEAARRAARRPASCETYRANHPWIDAEGPSPKSILREMLESGDSFATFVRRYRLERSEGLVLRYLTDAWRTLDRSLPDDAYTTMLEDVVDWLGALIRATDATLLDEWTVWPVRPVHDHVAIEAPTVRAGPAARVAHRGAHRRVRLGRAAGARARTSLAERCGWGPSGSPRRWRPTGPSTTDRHRRRRPRGRPTRRRPLVAAGRPRAVLTGQVSRFSVARAPSANNTRTHTPR
jgi:hypothetical protein